MPATKKVTLNLNHKLRMPRKKNTSIVQHLFPSVSFCGFCYSTWQWWGWVVVLVGNGVSYFTLLYHASNVD